jgi:NitT/TauT family transport system ATP-binding protein
MTVPRLRVQGITKRFPRPGNPGDLEVIANLNLDAAAGEFLCLLGPSGCGKTTLFNMIAGVDKPTAGDILLNGEVMSGRKGLVGYMLQRDVLLPWRTVLENARLALELKGVGRVESRAVASRYLKDYGLAGFEDYYPCALSEGMRQRVALVRTVVCEHDVVLFDEPFSSVDYKVRLLLERQVYDLVRVGGRTVVFVTHDIESAVALGDRVVVLSRLPCRVVAERAVGLARAAGGPMEARRAPDFGKVFADTLKLYYESNEGDS